MCAFRSGLPLYPSNKAMCVVAPRGYDVSHPQSLDWRHGRWTSRLTGVCVCVGGLPLVPLRGTLTLKKPSQSKTLRKDPLWILTKRGRQGRGFKGPLENLPTHATRCVGLSASLIRRSRWLASLSLSLFVRRRRRIVCTSVGPRRHTDHSFLRSYLYPSVNKRKLALERNLGGGVVGDRKLRGGVVGLASDWCGGVWGGLRRKSCRTRTRLFSAHW
jgi:hypothetical protein